MKRLMVAAAFLLAGVAQADSSLPASQLAYTQLPDAEQEAQAQALMETLRCLVCQGQSIADSDADMAGEMRALVRQRMDVSNQARPLLGLLRDRAQEAVHLAILSQGEVVYLYNLESAQAIGIRSYIGVRKPAFCTCEGRVMLAFGAPEQGQHRLLLGAFAWLGRRTDAVAGEDHHLGGLEMPDVLRVVVDRAGRHAVRAGGNFAHPAARLQLHPGADRLGPISDVGAGLRALGAAGGAAAEMDAARPPAMRAVATAAKEGHRCQPSLFIGRA